MADKKISQLGATTTPADPDLYAIVQSGVTKKITHANLKAGILNSSGLTVGVFPYWDGSDFVDGPLLFDSGDIVLSALIKSPDLNSVFALYGGTNGGTIAHQDGTINSTLLADSNNALISWSDGTDSGNLQASQSRTFLNHTALIEFDAPAYQYTQLTASTVPYLDASKNLVSSGITPTELGYLSGATSNLQTQINSLTDGLYWKEAVRAATTSAGTLATSFENGDTIDGVVLSTGDRILIKNQASAVENGIYVVNASGAPTRATDFDSGADNLAGATVAVQEGTVNADLQFVCSSNAPVTIGVSNITFVLVGGTTYIGTTNRITVTGNVIDIGTDVVTLTGSQTLTNKTITSPTINTSLNAAYATASTVSYFDGSKNLVSSATTDVELGYLSGVTSSIQTQFGLPRRTKIESVNVTPHVVTTTGTDEIAHVHQIGAGPVSANGCIIMTSTKCGATSSGNTKTYKMWINTVPDLTGSPVQIATVTSTTNAVSLKFERFFNVISNTSILCFAGTSASASETNSSSAFTTPTVPSLSAGFYIIITANRAVGTDTVTVYESHVNIQQP